MDQLTKYLGQRLFSSKVISGQTPDQVLYLDH